MQLVATPLCAAAFSPFGRVISAHGACRPANDARAQRFFNLAPLAHEADASRAEVSIYRIAASALPVRVDYLERHPLSSQVFMPTGAARYLVVVAPSDAAGAPDIGGLLAWVGKSGEGVVYNPGVWHYPLISLDASADFLMLMWESDTAADSELAQLKTSIEVRG